MPIYEYRCSRCHYQFETVHGVGETVDRCERCGGPVRRVFSPPALIFKGPGFHVTDYRKTAPPSDGDGKASGSAKGTSEKGASESKVETKSATKTSGTGGAGNGASGAGDGKKAS
jgi:putative FmdB family regulatory protein